MVNHATEGTFCFYNCSVTPVSASTIGTKSTAYIYAAYTTQNGVSALVASAELGAIFSGVHCRGRGVVLSSTGSGDRFRAISAPGIGLILFCVSVGNMYLSVGGPSAFENISDSALLPGLATSGVTGSSVWDTGTAYFGVPVTGDIGASTSADVKTSVIYNGVEQSYGRLTLMDGTYLRDAVTSTRPYVPMLFYSLDPIPVLKLRQATFGVDAMLGDTIAEAGGEGAIIATALTPNTASTAYAALWCTNFEV